MALLRFLFRSLMVVVLAAVLWFGYLYVAAGQTRELVDSIPGQCVEVPGAPGAEDITIDRFNKTALISSDPRDGSPGGVFAYSLSESDSPLRNLTKSLGRELYPHGLSLWSPENAQVGVLIGADSTAPGEAGARLFVVNHPRDSSSAETDPENTGASGSSVEIFGWDGVSLEDIGPAITDPLLFQLNDVVAVDQRRFYATRDHGSVSGLGILLEDLSRRGRGAVVYWDGERARVVAENIAYANGINRSADGKQIYVASTTSKTIRVFARDLETGDLSPLRTIETNTGVDNIEVDRHGYLWVGAHPKMLSFMRHAGDRSRLSPTEVLWIDPDQQMEPWLRPVYLEKGELISGGSVAAPTGGRFLIGSVFEPHFLVCDRS